MIRYLCRQGQNLLVLDEIKQHKWKIKCYPKGLTRIKKRLDGYFGDEFRDIINIPHGCRGTLNPILSKAQYKDAELVDVSRKVAFCFYRKFIDDIFLKADTDNSFEVFLTQNSERGSGYSSHIIRRINEDLNFEIEKTPYIIGIPDEDRLAYHEVSLPNRLSGCFDDLQEFRRYLNNDMEPTITKRMGIAKPDLVLYSPGKVYIIEIKTLHSYNPKKITEIRRVMRKQLLLSSLFIKKNFDIQVVPVGVQFCYTGSKESLRYTHFKLNEEERKLEVRIDSSG